MLVVITFGGCPLYNPLRVLKESGIANHAFRAMGFKRPPFALSSGAAIQLLKFARGELAISKAVRDLCYGDPDPVPEEREQEVLRRADVILVEMSTPIEIVYKGFILNNNRVKDRFLMKICQRLPQLQKTAIKWRSTGLQGLKQDVRAAMADEMLKVLPSETERDLFVRDIVASTTARETKTAQIVADLRYIQSQVSIPIGIIMHNFNYMPDGRPISWPGDFRDNCFAAAKELGIPVYDPAPLVAQYGTAFSMKNERHYSDRFLPLVADAFHEFMLQLTNQTKVSPVQAMRRVRRERPGGPIERVVLGL